MTVCIAAACELGQVVVAATDGAITLGEISVDNMMPKMVWQNDWLFMYAGEPSNADLFLEQIREQIRGKQLSRDNILDIVHEAFVKRFARWSSDAWLSPFDLDIEEFKKSGRNVFGDDYAAQIAKGIHDTSNQFADRLLLIGWGKTQHAVMIHEENKDGSVSHAFPGFAAIGSGGPTAASQLLLLGQGRHRSLPETLYSVAAAKFSAEVAGGVGESTTIYVTWKRREEDANDRPPGKFIQLAEIDALRAIWNGEGKPKIPKHVFNFFLEIARKSGIPHFSTGTMLKSIESSMQSIPGKSKRKPRLTSGPQK